MRGRTLTTFAFVLAASVAGARDAPRSNHHNTRKYP